MGGTMQASCAISGHIVQISRWLTSYRIPHYYLCILGVRRSPFASHLIYGRKQKLPYVRSRLGRRLASNKMWSESSDSGTARKTTGNSQTKHSNGNSYIRMHLVCTKFLIGSRTHSLLCVCVNSGWFVEWRPCGAYHNQFCFGLPMLAIVSSLHSALVSSDYRWVLRKQFRRKFCPISNWTFHMRTCMVGDDDIWFSLPLSLYRSPTRTRAVEPLFANEMLFNQ